MQTEELQNWMRGLLTSVIQEEVARERNQEFMTIEQAAAYCKFTVSTLYTYCSQKRIPYIKKGSKLLFEKRKLDEWLREGEVERERGADIQALRGAQNHFRFM